MSAYRTFYLLSYSQNTKEIDYQIGHTTSHKANVVLVCCWFTVTTIPQEVQTDICKISHENGSSHKNIFWHINYRSDVIIVLSDALLSPPA